MLNLRCIDGHLGYPIDNKKKQTNKQTNKKRKKSLCSITFQNLRKRKMDFPPRSYAKTLSCDGGLFLISDMTKHDIVSILNSKEQFNQTCGYEEDLKKISRSENITWSKQPYWISKRKENHKMLRTIQVTFYHASIWAYIDGMDNSLPTIDDDSNDTDDDCRKVMTIPLLSWIPICYI